jgi:hypothetical protein
MTMAYLETRSGRLSSHAIDLVESPSASGYCRVFYHCGNEPRETTAHWEDVADFYGESPVPTT